MFNQEFLSVVQTWIVQIRKFALMVNAEILATWQALARPLPPVTRKVIDPFARALTGLRLDLLNLTVIIVTTPVSIIYTD